MKIQTPIQIIMKTIRRLVGALCASLFCIHQAQAAAAPATESGVQLTIELRDGSHVVGKSLEDTLGIHSAALGDMELPWAGIHSIEFAGTNTSAARLTATNGDVFAITLAAESLRVETGFGQTELPVRLIRSVKVAPPATPAAVAGGGIAQLAIELRDGSHVVGKGLDDSLGFHSSAMGDLKLTWAGIRSIEYAGTNTEMARLTATNGDVYEVQFAATAVHVETSFGKTELPVKLIRGVKVVAVGNAGHGFSSLVARWTGDGNAQDSVGHCDGQVSGGVSYVAGPTVQAFLFNGGDSRVDFGNSAGNFGTSDFTIAFWMKTASRVQEEAILSKRVTCDGTFCFEDIRIGSVPNPTQVPVGFLDFSIESGGYRECYDLVSSHPVNDGQWHHIAWTRQSTGAGGITGQLYIDGALDKSTTYPEVVDLVNQAPLVLGQDVCQGRDGTTPYRGALADLRLYSQGLAAEEILGIYNEGKRQP
jgi:hypothetical protein